MTRFRASEDKKNNAFNNGKIQKAFQKDLVELRTTYNRRSSQPNINGALNMDKIINFNKPIITEKLKIDINR